MKQHRFNLVAVMALAVSSFTLMAPVQAQTTPGPRPVAVLLCNYADMPDTFGITAARVQDMWAGARSIDGLVREASWGAVSLEGTRTFGWFALPSPAATYTAGTFFRSGVAEASRDCVASARAGGVDLSPFMYVAVNLNGMIPGAAGIAQTQDFGGRPSVTTLNSTIMDVRGLTSSGLILHELGHLFGAGHTNSASDPLGGAAGYGDNPLRPRRGVPVLRTMNPSPAWDASTRDAMGLIPANRKVVFAGGTQTITISRLTQPTEGPVVIEVPLADNIKLMVSARTRIGYDALFYFDPEINFGQQWFGLVNPGVQIVRVRPPRADVEVVMSNPAGDRSGTDGVWLTGQSYVDNAAGLRITIDRFDDAGAQITIVAGPPGQTPPP